jgi:hypothetical protein
MIVPVDFMILDMGDEEIPLILGRPFLNTTNSIIYVRSGWKSSFNFQDGR